MTWQCEQPKHLMFPSLPNAILPPLFSPAVRRLGGCPRGAEMISPTHRICPEGARRNSGCWRPSRLSEMFLTMNVANSSGSWLAHTAFHKESLRTLLGTTGSWCHPDFLLVPRTC